MIPDTVQSEVSAVVFTDIVSCTVEECQSGGMSDSIRSSSTSAAIHTSKSLWNASSANGSILRRKIACLPKNRIILIFRDHQEYQLMTA